MISTKTSESPYNQKVDKLNPSVANIEGYWMAKDRESEQSYLSIVLIDAFNLGER